MAISSTKGPNISKIRDGAGLVAVVQLDFAHAFPRKCGESDFDEVVCQERGCRAFDGAQGE
jgi:hypothetical protein